MTDLTLPGSIPGLLRRGSPVLEGATECVIVSIGDVDDAGVPYAMAAECVAEHVNCCPLGDLSLDLADATGRAHAAWWLSARCPDGVPSIGESRRAVLLAKGGYEMSGDLIRALRLVCLHVAGMGVES